QQVTRIESAIHQISLGVIFTATSVTSAILYVGGERGWGTMGFMAAGVIFVMITLRGRGDR
ncbi:MAG TPA: hypothetical protein PLD47_17130, partial [Aggregatilineales bacterium]|nr:hypothetical protein [Aggregatilineales bacterium]